MTTAEEALEKIRKGMHILVREGSVSKDLHALMPVITERLSPFLALCTDDRNPLDIAEQGHLDYMIRTAIAQGSSHSPSIAPPRFPPPAHSASATAALSRRAGAPTLPLSTVLKIARRRR